MSLRAAVMLFVPAYAAMTLAGCPKPAAHSAPTPPSSSASTAPTSSTARVLAPGQAIVDATGACVTDDDCVLTMGSHSHCGGGCYPYVTTRQVAEKDAAQPDPFGPPGSPCPSMAPCPRAPYRDVAAVCDRGTCAAIREPTN